MQTLIHKDRTENGLKAAKVGADAIRRALAAEGHANLIVATGASQFEMLAELVKAPDIAWNRITAFHLDEYVGMPITHPASFRKYLWERFVRVLPLPLKAFHYVEGDAPDPHAECRRLAALIREAPIDVAFVGIGENGHLAFNDPPADFETDDPYLVVTLDEACRKQQFGEGWFPTMADVPTTAISMSCRQIMKSKSIIVTCPDARKADAVKMTVEGPISNLAPASILQRHADCRLYIDTAAASKLTSKA
jgi:glucosamine-6-phosphate deaminase